MKQTILTSVLNKASDSDDLSFAIIQKVFKTIFKIFYKIYSALIEHEYHLNAEEKTQKLFLKR